MTPSRTIALRVAWHYLGTPYRWGGDDPMAGFDCSGFAIECLQAAGAFPRGRDTTAEGLRTLYPSVADPEPGDLVFWMQGHRAVHVGVLVDPSSFYIGAEGGGSRTKTLDDAERQNAYIAVRPVASRGSPETRVYATPYGAWQGG